jgi:hypothetical protein
LNSNSYFKTLSRIILLILSSLPTIILDRCYQIMTQVLLEKKTFKTISLHKDKDKIENLRLLEVKEELMLDNFRSLAKMASPCILGLRPIDSAKCKAIAVRNHNILKSYLKQILYRIEIVDQEERNLILLPRLTMLKKNRQMKFKN